jgi:diaminohydroxyphosphoribosylaminopyrimidine deaminase/5-amino-6-(5-phosphoribosylamino)uracil reductase
VCFPISLAFSALKHGLVDKVVSFIAPKILGGAKAPTAVGGKGISTMEEAINIKNMRIKKVGNDLMVEGWI